MKHTSSILLIIITITLLSGCSFPLLRDSLPTQGHPAETNPEFTVEQVVLLQSFQNTEPRVELQKKNSQLRLLISPGIVRSTGMEVSNIEEMDGVYNIHLVNSSYSSAELVIPQIIILLSEVSPAQAESMEFNIVNENYTPLKVNHKLVDILKKVKSDFRISIDGHPSIKLIEDDKEPLWVIEYKNIYDTENLEIPVINLRVKVNANSGQVVESSKGLISSFIDHGTILEHVPGKGMIYWKKGLDLSVSELWYYNLMTAEKTSLYKTSADISSAQLNPEGSMIAILEKDGDNSTAFVISFEDKKAVRIGSEINLLPEMLSWKSNDEVQVLSEFHNQESRIFIYNILDNSIRPSHSMLMDISTFHTLEDMILATEFTEGELNNKILASDGTSGLRFVDDGFKPEILNESLGMYLKNDKNSTTNSLHIFDLRTLEERYMIDFDVASTRWVSPDELLIVEKLPGNNMFSVHLLNIPELSMSTLGGLNSGKVYFDKEHGKIYANPSITYRSDNTEIIYSMDLSDLEKR
ncbi:MAG: hypothetical protein ACQEP4_06320 [Bacillota bacterium]